MNPTLEQVKEWVDELIPAERRGGNFNRFTWVSENREVIMMVIFNHVAKKVLFQVEEHGNWHTQFAVPPNKQEFKTLLELSGVIDKG